MGCKWCPVSCTSKKSPYSLHGLAVKNDWVIHWQCLLYHLPFMTGWHVVEPIGDWVPCSEWTLSHCWTLAAVRRILKQSNDLWACCQNQIWDAVWLESMDHVVYRIAKSKSIGSGASASSSQIFSGLKLSWSDCVAVGDSSLGPFKTMGICPAWAEQMCCVLPDFDLHCFEQIGHSHHLVDSEYWRSGLQAGCGIEKLKLRVHMFGP